MSYHLKEIPKGEVGELSKITEEYEELQDAVEQEDKILVLCELTDLVGAIDLFVQKHYNLTIDDVNKFSKKTQNAFKTGTRK